LHAHVQNWQKWDLASGDVLARLNLQFDALISALEINNKASARAALRALAAEARSHRHRRLHDIDGKEDDDDEDETGDARPTPFRGRGAYGSAALTLDRTAARALLFDLRYLFKRLHARD
jgi:hypothetical protein